MKKILIMIFFVFFILFLPFTKISFACNFNCGGTYTKNDEYGLKTTSHSGYKKHAFWHVPKKDYSHKYIRDKSKARAGKAFQRFELRDGDCFYKKGVSWNDCKMNRERFEFSSRPKQKPKGKQCNGYSIKLGKNFKSVNPIYTDLGQVHQTGGPKGTADELKSFPPLIQIGAKNNDLYFGWYKLTGNANNVIDKEWIII